MTRSGSAGRRAPTLRSPRRWWRRLAYLGASMSCVLLCQLATSTPAAAHAEYVSSVPADGETLTDAPRQVSIVMSESVDVQATSATLTDGAGRRVATRGVRVVPAPGSARDDRSQLIIALPALSKNSYLLAWQTTSSDDRHVSSGSLVFGVGLQAAAGQRGTPAGPAPSPLEVIVRWFGFLSLGAALGSGTLLVLLRSGDAVEGRVHRARVRLLGLAVVGSGLALLAGVGLLLVQPRTSDHGMFAAAWQVVSDTPYGPRWVTREAGIAVLFGVALLLWRWVRAGAPVPSRNSLAIVLAPAVVAIVVASALLGHSGAATGSRPAFVLVDAVHLLAAMIWAGSLVAAAVALLPSREPNGRRLATQVLLRFAVVALSSATVLVVTGLLLAGNDVASLDALLLSVYGRALMVKLSLVAAAVALGLVNLVLFRWRPAKRLAARTVGAEAALLVGVLLAAAFITSAEPATGPQWRPSSQPAAVPVLPAAEQDLVETVTVKPNRPGRNFVNVNVFDTRRPAPAAVSQVLVTLRPTGGPAVRVAALPNGAGGYVLATDKVASSGRWRITVAVMRPGLPPTVHDFEWRVAPADAAARPAVVSKAPLARILDWIAWCLLGVVVLGSGIVRIRRHRPPPIAPGPTSAVGALVR